jgi:hypothetical protein
MMLNTKTFIPRFHQLKLHIEAQTGLGVRRQYLPFPHMKSLPRSVDTVFPAELTVQDIFMAAANIWNSL